MGVNLKSFSSTYIHPSLEAQLCNWLRVISRSSGKAWNLKTDFKRSASQDSLSAVTFEEYDGEDAVRVKLSHILERPIDSILKEFPNGIASFFTTRFHFTSDCWIDVSSWMHADTTAQYALGTIQCTPETIEETFNSCRGILPERITCVPSKEIACFFHKNDGVFDLLVP